MSKLERLNTRVEKLLVAAVHEVLEVVKETVLEYQEKTARTQRENESLRRRLRELQDKQKRDGHPVELLANEEWHHGENATLSPNESGEEKQRSQPQLSAVSANRSIGSDEPLSSPEEATDTLVKEELVFVEEPEAGSDVLIPGSNYEEESVSVSDIEHFGCKPQYAYDSTAVNGAIVASSNSLNVQLGPASDNIKTESLQLRCATGTEKKAEFPLNRSLGSSIMMHSKPIEDQEHDPCPYELYYVQSDLDAIAKAFVSTDSEKSKQIYSTQKRYSCALCKKNFGNMERLRIHQMQHTGEKPYCCSQCGRCFNHAGDFKKHKRVHTGEKPYCCTICGKGFSQSGYLKIHLRYHTGERPFCCTHCGKRFSQSSHLKTHQKIHLNEML